MRVFVFIVVLLVGLALIGGLGYLANSAQENQVTMKAMEYQQANELDFDKYAISEQANVAEDGLKAAVAIAVSGDIAQASMVRSMATSTVAFAIIFIVLTVLIISLTNRPPVARQNSFFGVPNQQPSRGQAEGTLFAKYKSPAGFDDGESGN